MSLALSVYATDLDADDDVDVLGTGYNTDGLFWWENDGSQVFTEHNLEGDAEQINFAYAADLDGDGDMDILGAGNNITWFENDGSQSFTEHTIATWSDCQYAPPCGGGRDGYATDVDGDGDIDVLGATYNTQVPYNNYKIIWWENDGSQSFICLLYTSPSPRDS